MGIMELGAIGELIGGVAVIATLVYLAVQVRQIEQRGSYTPGFQALVEEPSKQGIPMFTTVMDREEA